ncbi:hypothetical protein EMIT0232MI5_100182 [Pseudomonas sp. IT-232MI5]
MLFMCCLSGPHRWQASSHRDLRRLQNLNPTPNPVGAGLPAMAI